MTATIQQTKVTLRCADNLVTFNWPIGASQVTVSQSMRDRVDCLSIEEAHCLFDGLLDAGAY
jgi:hypothetical protein